jgi:hypothetical protein
MIVGARPSARLNDGLGEFGTPAPSLDRMNLARHVAVLWRFRTLTAAGLLLGIFLAIFASYRITPHGLEARGVSTYASVSQLLVTQDGFPEGRVVLPVTPITGSTSDGETPKIDPNKLEFADPNRFMALADLYTKLIVSDEVRALIPERPSPAQIDAQPLPAVSGAPILPIIQLTVKSMSATGATQLNTHTIEALRKRLTEQQNKNGISPAQSVQIRTLSAPSAGALAAGPSHTASILALLLCIIGTIAVTHILASLRPSATASQVDDVMLDWDLTADRNGNGHRPETAVDEQLEGWIVPGGRERR